MNIRFSFFIACYFFIAAVCIEMFGQTTKSSRETAHRQQSELWLYFPGVDGGAGDGKEVVLIAGDDEYRSEEAMPMLGKILSRRYGFNCRVLFPINQAGVIQPDFQTNIPGMHFLDGADLIILGLRFRNLSDDQMDFFDQYLKNGKPIIGLRTSTHAFRIPDGRKYAHYSFNSTVPEWEGGFGRRILGETWVSHHGAHGSQSTRGIVNSESADHVILTGVQNVWGTSDVYTVRDLPSGAEVLLNGQVIDGMRPEGPAVDGGKNDPMMPLAWIRDYRIPEGKTGKVFCTTMGAATDLKSAGLRRLIVNASLWAVGLSDRIEAKSDVRFVDPYQPTHFGFGTYETGRKPSFYRLKTQNSKPN